MATIIAELDIYCCVGSYADHQGQTVTATSETAADHLWPEDIHTVYTQVLYRQPDLATGQVNLRAAPGLAPIDRRPPSALQ